MTIAKRLEQIKSDISLAARKYERDEQEITLLAVSKKQSIAKIKAAYEAGINQFAESYAQEAQEKISRLTDCAISWHFIGPIQSNKTKFIAEHFVWVHSVDRLKIAKRLSSQRPHSMPALNCLIQVNLAGEAQKQGVSVDQVNALAQEINELPHIKLQGLMTLPKQSTDFEQQINSFMTLSNTLKRLNQTLNLNLKHLSMGMSADYLAAIAAGSTFIRIGTALFGPREIT